MKKVFQFILLTKQGGKLMGMTSLSYYQNLERLKIKCLESLKDLTDNIERDYVEEQIIEIFDTEKARKHC
jgi:hypothetical protein